MQSALQPAGLVVPLPLPWLTAFFRNVALFAAIGHPQAVRTARKQAVLWTGQTWGILAFSSLAFLLLFLNFVIMIILVPQLARSFLGIEGDFVRSGVHLSVPPRSALLSGLAWMVIRPGARRGGLRTALLLWRINRDRRRSARGVCEGLFRVATLAVLVVS